jgi:hypothetical protein
LVYFSSIPAPIRIFLEKKPKKMPQKAKKARIGVKPILSAKKPEERVRIELKR